MEKIRKILLKNSLPILAGVIMVGGIIYAWTEPTTAPPSNNVPAPINIGATTQTKQGGDICVNIAGVTKCLSTGGGDLSNVRVGPPGCNNILTFSATCYTQACGEYTHYAPNWAYVGTYYFTCGGSCSAYSSMSCSTASVGTGATFLYGSIHSTDGCTAAGGTVQQDGTDKFCKFDRTSCPSGWTQFKNWTTTSSKTCTGTTNDNSNCPSNSSMTCSTGSHSFSDHSLESCSYLSSRTWTSYDYECGGWGTCWYWTQCIAAGVEAYIFDCEQPYPCYVPATCSASYCADSWSTCWANTTTVGCY